MYKYPQSTSIHIAMKGTVRYYDTTERGCWVTKAEIAPVQISEHHPRAADEAFEISRRGAPQTAQ